MYESRKENGMHFENKKEACLKNYFLDFCLIDGYRKFNLEQMNPSSISYFFSKNVSVYVKNW